MCQKEDNFKCLYLSFFCVCFFSFFFFFLPFLVITQNLLISQRNINAARRTFEAFVKDKAAQIQVLMGIEDSTKVVRATELSTNREFQIPLIRYT